MLNNGFNSVTDFVEINACMVKNCETCSFVNPNICINCNQGYTRNRALGCAVVSQNNQIIQFGVILIENCASYTNDSTCETCFVGYSLINNRCSPICKENCSCFEPNECFEVNLFITIGCIDNCEYCISNQCFQCNAGYYLSTNVCYACYSSCSICSDYETCIQCSPGNFLLEGYCISCFDRNCFSCSDSNTCIQCNTNYYLMNENC